MNEVETTIPPLPRRPLLELLLRTREGLASYKAIPLGAAALTEVEPAKEARYWLEQCIISHPLMQKYLDGINPISQPYVVNRIVDSVCQTLYSTLEPWRSGKGWRDFEGYAYRLVGVACWTSYALNEQPCNPK